MRQIKKIIFSKNSPCLHCNDNRELNLIVASFILILLIFIFSIL